MTESDETIGYSGFGSVLMGAIFMCNRETKKECLQRRLFGLPSNHEGFVKKVRAGMMLFLFEYEERKLHGVFEATSDGGSNIVPNAFCSSGKLISAQVHCKRLWHCKPLSEDEFSMTIKENYYTPQKFNFALSGDQVLKLLCLFNSRKVNGENKFKKESLINLRRDHGVPHPPRKGKLRLNTGHSVHFREPFTGAEESTLVRAQYLPSTIPPHDITQSGSLQQSQEDESYLRNTHDTSLRGHHPSYEVPRQLHERPATYIALSTDRESEYYSWDASSIDPDPQHCQCQSGLHPCFVHSKYSVHVAGGTEPLPSQPLPNSHSVLLESRNSFPSCTSNNNMKCSSGSSSYDVYIPLSIEMPLGPPPQPSGFINQQFQAMNKFSSQLPQNPYPPEGWQSGSNGQQQQGVDRLQTLPGADRFGSKSFGSSLQYPPNEEHIKPASDHLLKSIYGEDYHNMGSPISLGASFDDWQINYRNEDVMSPHGALPCIEPVTNDGHGELHSDKRQRVSVFSRLSRSPNTEWMSHSNQHNISSNMHFGISLEQLVETLAERRSFWQTVNTDNGRVCKKAPFAELVSCINYSFGEVVSRTNVPFGQHMPKMTQPKKGWGENPFQAGYDEKCSGHVAKLQSDENSASDIRQSDDEHTVGYSGAERFINFKRRSEVQKAGEEAIKGDSIGNKSDECSFGKLKRRKLVRPSFCKNIPAVNSKGNMISSPDGEKDDATVVSTSIGSDDSVNRDMRTVVKNDFCHNAGDNVYIPCQKFNSEYQIVGVPNIEDKKINDGKDSLVEPGSFVSSQEENDPKVAVCDVNQDMRTVVKNENNFCHNAGDNVYIPCPKFNSEYQIVGVPNIEDKKIIDGKDSLVEPGSFVSSQEENDPKVAVCDALAVERGLVDEIKGFQCC